MIAVSDAFDRERAAWLAGHGGDERGYAVESDEGQRLRWKWEEADMVLSESWDRCSRQLRPSTMPEMVLPNPRSVAMRLLAGKGFWVIRGGGE